MSANDAAHDTSHESLIKTPQQLIVVMVLAFVVPVVFLIMMAKFVLSANKNEAASASPETVVSRIKPVAELNISASGSGPRTGEEIVQSVCTSCHGAGLAGAPKIGDNGAWGPRIARGLPSLVSTAIKGKGAMPPRGGAGDLSDFEVTRAIVFMADKSGGSFKEPAAPAPAKDAAKK